MAGYRGSYVFPKQTAAPSGAVSGQVYYNTTDNNFYGYNGTAWVNLALGIDPTHNWKQSVKAATTANIAAITTAPGTTIDGVTMVAGDRFLAKDQTTPSQNGIYVWASSTSATRATDFDAAGEVNNASIAVDQGAVNGDTIWYCSAATVPPTIGTTALYFKRAMPIYGHGNSRFPWDIGGTTSPVIGATLPRSVAQGTFSLAVAATQYLVGGIVVPAGRTVTNINYVATTAGATPTVDWIALARVSDRVVVAHTANSTAAPTANAITARALAAAWTAPADTPCWIIWSLNIATTARVVVAGPTGTAAVNLVAPAVAATNGVAPTTTLPTDGTTVITAATTGITNVPLLWIT